MLFHGEHVVAAGADDEFGGVGLGVHRVQGQDRPGQVQDPQRGSHGGDLIGFRGDGDLARRSSDLGVLVGQPLGDRRERARPGHRRGDPRRKHRTQSEVKS